MTLFGKLLLAATFTTLAGCGKVAPPAAPTAAEIAAIKAVSADWKTAYNARDAAAVAALYGEGAVLSAPGMPAIEGKAAISDYFIKTVAAFSSSGLTVIDEPMGEVVTSGDLAWQWQTYKVTDAAGAVVDAGKLVTLLQRQNGKWLIVGDTWNSDGSAGTPTAP